MGGGRAEGGIWGKGLEVNQKECEMEMQEIIISLN